MAMYLISTLFIMVDWGQSRDIALSPGHYETNVITGKYPSRRRVDKYFMGALVLNTAVFTLPRKYRAPVWASVMTVEFSYITTNAGQGLKINWQF